MKTKILRVKQAESAIKSLRDAVDGKNKDKIVTAMNSIELDNDFDWEDLGLLFSEWDDLCDMAHDILYEDM